MFLKVYNALRFIIGLFKKCIITYQYFTLDKLDSRMKSFDFGPQKGLNKPQTFSDKFNEKSNFKYSARYSASEMATFVRNLGAIIGDSFGKFRGMENKTKTNLVHFNT